LRTGLWPFEGCCAVVRPEWLEWLEWSDGNGHMSLACYVLVFDAATDLLCEAIGFGAAHRRSARTGVFVANHILYRTELLLGDQVCVRPQVVGADAKRIHLAHGMLRGDAPAAHQELMLLHLSVLV
jgi:acyl-CoA thioester hydrolase